MIFLHIRLNKTVAALALLVALADPAFAMGRRAAASGPAPAPTPAVPAGPTQKIVMLSSLDMSGVRVPFYLFWKRRYYRNYEHKLENEFRWFFEGQGYEIETRRGADQFDLWGALHAPENVAVFWVSHSAAPASGGAGLSSDGMIADWDGFDVAPALQEVHPNLRFLGIVGCKSEQVLLKILNDRGLRARNPELEVQAFSTKVDGRRGLNWMMWESKKTLDRPAVREGYESACPESAGHALTVRRSFQHIDLPNPVAAQRDSATKFLPSVRLETATGVTLGVFPPGRLGADGQALPQEITVHLAPDAPLGGAYELKLVENSGENPAATSDEIEVGDLDFSEPWAGARWTVFANREGRPLGSTSRVYRYTGPLPIADAPAPAAYRPFVCAPMPARAGR